MQTCFIPTQQGHVCLPCLKCNCCPQKFWPISGVRENRLQNIVITLDKVLFCWTRTFADPVLVSSGGRCMPDMLVSFRVPSPGQGLPAPTRPATEPAFAAAD